MGPLLVIGETSETQDFLDGERLSVFLPSLTREPVCVSVPQTAYVMVRVSLGSGLRAFGLYAETAGRRSFARATRHLL